jgi:hypothetical protein
LKRSIRSILNEQTDIPTYGRSLRFPCQQTCSICSRAQSQLRSDILLWRSTGEFRCKACLFFRMSLGEAFNFPSSTTRHALRYRCDRASRKKEPWQSCARAEAPRASLQKSEHCSTDSNHTQHAARSRPQKQKDAIRPEMDFLLTGTSLLRGSVSHSPQREAGEERILQLETHFAVADFCGTDS